MTEKIHYGPVRFANNGVKVCERVGRPGWVCVEPDGTPLAFDSKDEAIAWSRNYEGATESTGGSGGYSYFKSRVESLSEGRSSVSKASGAGG